MKTCLYSPCFLEGYDLIGNNRLERNRRYLDYYTGVKEDLGVDDIILYDNASADTYITALKASHPTGVTLFRASERLTHGAGKHDYPYCWRALYEFDTLFHLGYDKIIMIDSDGFVLSKRLAQYIKNTNTGWVSFKSTTHEFPDCSLQILNRDAYPVFKRYAETPWKERVGCTMERDIPFTLVSESFNVGRFGEEYLPQSPGMDYYGQAPFNIELEYGKYE